MIDPISLAGLALASVDQLLKLGERTAELVSDIRTFDEHSKFIYDKIDYENSRTRSLRGLLFKPASTYGGQTLFEQFDEEVQDQVKLWLVQLRGVLHEAHAILEGRYIHTTSPVSPSTSRDSLSPISASTTELSRSKSLSGLSGTTLPKRSTSPRVPLREATKSPLLLVRWSFKDKKRVEVIVQKFGELNARIHKNIEIECFGLAIGVNNNEHLEHLAADDDSKILGFSSDAALKLTADQARSMPGRLELLDDSWDEILCKGRAFEERFAVCQFKDRYLLQEYRSYHHGVHPGSIDDRTRERAEALAKLLLQPKKTMYRIPKCVGWKYLVPQNRIAFVFDIPEGREARPRSLLRLLSDSGIRPSLGDKFRLAHGLARCIAQLQMVKWVHESFRSENILFFPPKSTEEKKSITPKVALDYGEPWLMGFEFSRPEADFSTGFIDIHPARDVYRHPERQGRPQRMFNKMHDIYALGVVLLEIGLWSPALSLQKDQFDHARDPTAVKDRLVKNANVRLGSYVGDRYRDIVIRCLNGDFGIKEDTKEDLRLQQAFRSQVVDVLEKAANSI